MQRGDGMKYFQQGMSDLRDGLLARKRMEMEQAKFDLEKQEVAARMKDREMRTALMSQRAGGRSQFNPGESSGIPDDLAEAMGVAPAPAQGQGRRRGGGGSGSDPMRQVSDLYQLMSAGEKLKGHSTPMQQRLTDLDAMLAQIPSTDPKRSLVQMERESVAGQLQKVSQMGDILQAVGGSYVMKQFPEDKENWTEAQRKVAGVTGIQTPSSTPVAVVPVSMPAGGLDPMGSFTQDLLQNGNSKAQALPEPDALPAVNPAPAPAQGIPVGQTATNPKTGRKLRWDGKSWVASDVAPRG